MPIRGTGSSNDTLDTVCDRGAETDKDIIVGDVVKNRDGEITRDGNDYISTIAKTGGRTLTITRDGNNLISSITDGTRTWTFTRDVNSYIESWAITT